MKMKENHKPFVMYWLSESISVLFLKSLLVPNSRGKVMHFFVISYNSDLKVLQASE